MTHLSRRAWVSDGVEDYVGSIASWVGDTASNAVEARIGELASENKAIHEADCVNLNPAANVMNPRAEALLSCGLSSRPSLGYPGDKYEMGLEAIEKIEVIAAELAAEIFHAAYVEIRVASGTMANLYAFMATCRPGDAIIVPPAAIGGHVTHNRAGAAGLYGLAIHEAPVTPDYTIDLDALSEQVRDLRPKLITLGASLNLFAWDVAKVRAVADTVGARVLFDAAHACGMIAGGVFPDPLAEGAYLMTMSTYKSFGGPAGGLVVTNDADLAAKIDAIAFPGLTANFDVAKSAALAVTLLDWREYGADYANEMVATAQALSSALKARGLPVFETARGATGSHQFALRAQDYGGGQAASRRLRQSNILACGIGLPQAEIAGDMNGLRIGTPEIVRFGMGPQHMETLADLFARALTDSDRDAAAHAVTAFRRQFNKLHFVR